MWLTNLKKLWCVEIWFSLSWKIIQAGPNPHPNPSYKLTTQAWCTQQRNGSVKFTIPNKHSYVLFDFHVFLNTLHSFLSSLKSITSVQPSWISGKRKHVSQVFHLGGLICNQHNKYAQSQNQHTKSLFRCFGYAWQMCTKVETTNTFIRTAACTYQMACDAS